MTSTFKITAIGDLHFGNPKLKAEDLYAKLVKYLYPELTNTQLLLLTGDTYDQLTTVNSGANRYVLKFIQDIYVMSHSTGMTIRILHGTYSHDRDQVSIFDNLALPYTRARVVSKMDCEELDCFGTKLKIAYIPDNLPYKHSEEVIEQLQKIYSCVGWDKADIILGHGSFDYALGCDAMHLPACTYTIQQFEPYIRSDGLIIMGHIHHPSHRANVYYCGSFDRMAHGEEEAKGFYVFTRQDKWVSRFVVNKDACPFITIKPEGDNLENKINYLLKEIDTKFPQRYGHIRILYDTPEERGIYQRVCLQACSDLIFSSKHVGDAETAVFKLDDLDIDTFTDVKPNVNNLGELTYNFLIDKNIITAMDKDVVINKVHELLTE